MRRQGKVLVEQLLLYSFLVWVEEVEEEERNRSCEVVVYQRLIVGGGGPLDGHLLDIVGMASCVLIQEEADLVGTLVVDSEERVV